MKYLVITFILLVSFQGFSQDYYEEEEPNIAWLTDIEEAKTQSKETKKPIIIYFTGSDWCGPCKMLKKDFFASEKFEKIAEGLIMVKVDMPRRKDIITKEQYQKNIGFVSLYNTSGGYPNLVALNAEGNIIGSLSGYTLLRETDKHFAFVESVIENYQ